MADTTAPVHVTVVLDRSGSMVSIASDIVGGLNTFLAEQRATPGEGRISLIQFDTGGYDVIVDGIDIHSVRDFEPAKYQPRGGTPLYDAVGRTIDAIDKEIARRADRGETHEDQLVAIITDGLENSSRAYARAKVFAMLEDRSERGWTFVFIGANQDAYEEGGHIGVINPNIKGFEATKASVRVMWESLSHETAMHRRASQVERERKRRQFFEEEQAGGR